jgi:TolA-binding protein
LRTLTPRICALLFLAGFAGAPSVRAEPRSDLDSLREEVRTLQRENEALAARVQALSSQVDLLTLRATRQDEPARAGGPDEAAPPRSAAGDAAAVPPDLAVVKMAPPTGGRVARPTAKVPRLAPPVPTQVPIQEPDAARLEAALSRPGRRALSAEADQDLREAQAMTGLLRAHSLEDFTGRYPQHPYADNALVDAAAAYAAAGREDAACALARRVVDEYPASDAQSDALERMAACATRRGATAEAQKLTARLRADFPGTPAAQRAEARLSQAPARDGDSPREPPARSGP